MVADHAVVGHGVVGVTGLSEIGCDPLVGVSSVKIICVDDREGPADRVSRCSDGVGGSPWFFTTFRDAETIGQIVKLLKCVVHFDFTFEPSSYAFSEGLGKVFADDEYDSLEACTDCIIDRIIEHGFAIRAHRVHLFEAAVSAAHACCEDE